MQFTPNGKQLVISIKDGPAAAGAAGGSRLVSYLVRSDGRLGNPRSRPSIGSDPTGFTIAPGRDGPVLLVAEAFGEPADTGGIASYQLKRRGNLIPVDHEAFSGFNCWVARNRAGDVAYVSSPASTAITRYAISRDGTVELLGDRIAPTMPDPACVQVALDQEGRFLYVLLPGIGSGGAFAIH